MGIQQNLPCDDYYLIKFHHSVSGDKYYSGGAQYINREN